MSAKGEQKERTRAAIVASACKLLRERGIAGASVADVMRGAGLTVGGFYAHFASKEALVAEALQRTCVAMRARLLERLEEKPVDARARLVLDRYLSSAHVEDAASGCPLPAVVAEIATSTPEHAPVLEEAIAAFAEELGAHLPAGESSRRRATALAMIALMYGGASLARGVRGTPLAGEILKACRAFGRRAIDAPTRAG